MPQEIKILGVIGIVVLLCVIFAIDFIPECNRPLQFLSAEAVKNCFSK